jgi:hypothetical protein
VEGNPELVCTQATDTERPPPGTSASADRNIVHPFQVSLKGKQKDSLHVHPLVPLSFLISSCLCFCSICFSGGADIPVSQTESTRACEMENVMVQAFVREDVEGLIQKVALLEGELVEAR